MAKKTVATLQWQVIAPLAALGLVHTFIHIFRVVDVVPETEGLAWLGIAAVWVAYVVSRDLPRPFLTLVLIGALYGVFSALVQQIFWTGFWTGYPPVQIGAVSLPIDSTPVRTIAVFSSIVCGLGWGALLGLVALVLRKPPKKAAPKRRKK